MAQQEALTIIAKVRPGRESRIAEVLEEMAKDPGHNRVLPFGKLASCHFGRAVMLPPTQDLNGRPLPAELIVLSDCDGSASKHLEQLVELAGDGIDRLFDGCEGFPSPPATREQRLAFLRRKRVQTKARYVHHPGRTVQQIRRERELRQMLQAYLAEHGFAEVSPNEVRRRLRTYCEHTGRLQWALDPQPSVPLKQRVRDAIHLVAAPLGVAAFTPVLAPTAAVVLLLARLQEKRDPIDDARPSPEHVTALAEIEDFFAHNGFTAGGFVKPGWVRQTIVRSVLPLIGYGTRHLFTRDSLAGVKTIHFARWIPIDGGRRVVFASNYDGSLEAYNNDFIDLVAWGLNLIFSNGLGYPKTSWLVFGGATREQEFKDYLRRHQIPTPVWYSAYRDLTALNIERNAKLRKGLRGRMSESEAKQWLRLL